MSRRWDSRKHSRAQGGRVRAARLTVFRHFFAPVADFTYTNLWHGWDLNFTYSTTFRGQFVRHYQRTIEYERRCRRPHGNKTFFIIRYVQVREGDLNENVNVQSGSFGLLCFEDKHLMNQIIYLLGQKHTFQFVPFSAVPFFLFHASGLLLHLYSIVYKFKRRSALVISDSEHKCGEGVTWSSLGGPPSVPVTFWPPYGFRIGSDRASVFRVAAQRPA